MSGMRGTIARRMLQSLQQSAQMTAIAQWDVTNLMNLRREMNKNESLGFRATMPGLMIFFLARVLKEMPIFNASVEGNEVHYWEDVNIGCAVAVADGLVVPVVHGADRLSLKEIQIRLADLIERARTKKLLPDDMAGGTFTLSNLGSYGSEYETVIVNPPEVALLGIGNAEKKPVVVNDQIVIREMMPISLTFDHRVIDGAAAGAFRQRLRQFVEQPGLILTCSQFGF
jgi:pyruvate/2-oxoglutarate dehydrogenase complex dihydrolipoamide acyltransferase (E2) component